MHIINKMLTGFFLLYGIAVMYTRMFSKEKKGDNSGEYNAV